jgi:hypothetical protein
MVEELLGVEGDDMDLRLLSQSFPSGTPRLEKRKVTANGDERYFLILESQTGREDEEVLTDGRRVLAEMTAIMLADGPGFAAPRVRGITKKMADGSLVTFLNASVHIQARAAVFVSPRLIGPDGEIAINKGPTEAQVIYSLARNNEPLRRAQVIYGSLEHNWINLYKVLDAMRDWYGGLDKLKARQFVSSKDIEKFTAAANSPEAVGLEDSRHGWDQGVKKAQITLAEAREMFRNLFRGWIGDLKRNEANPQLD